MSKLKSKYTKFPVFYFHVKENIGRKYNIEESLLKLSSNLVVINFELENELIKKNKFKEFTNTNTFEIAYDKAEAELGNQNLENLLTVFLKEFPNPELYMNHKRIQEFINGIQDGFQNKSIIIEEIMHLWL